MPGRITYVPPESHVCAGLPNPQEIHAPGTRWTCDTCAQDWVMVYGSQYNESYTAWRKMTAANATGRDL